MLVIGRYLSGEYDDRFSLERMRVSRLLPKFGRLSALLATSALLIPVYYTHAASTTTTTTTTTTKTKTFSGSQTSPIVTNGADITIASGGSITVSKGAAVTVNSSNSVDNEGTITGNDGSNLTGILVTKGGTGNILNDASITITDSTLATTISPTNGSLTNGKNRYGIQIDSATPYIGTITNSANGSIIVRGNNSAGIYLNTGGLQGSINNAGFIGITGSHSFGIQVNAGAPITGKGNGISISHSI